MQQSIKKTCKAVILFILSLCILSPTLSIQAEGEEEITFPAKIEDIFPDEVLASCVEGYIGKDTINSFTELNFQDIYFTCTDDEKGIESLEGIQYIDSLKTIKISGSNIKDLSPLTNMRSLESLRIHVSDETTDFSPIFTLTNLKELSLINAVELTSLDNIQLLNKLEYLSFGYCNINDIQCLSSVTSLKELFLFENKIADYSPISNLINLEILYINYSNIENIDFLATLINVERLDLYSNNISDISPLSSLTKLTNLNLGCNKVVDVSPLKNLTNLIWVCLDENKTVDLSTFKHLNNFTGWIYLENNEISDVSPLSEWSSSAKGINLNYNKILDISPLKSLNSVGSITIYGQYIEYEEQSINGKLTIANPINYKDGGYSNFEITHINKNGIYDKVNQTFSWNNITNNDNIVHFTFEGTSDNILHDGTVMITVNNINEETIEDNNSTKENINSSDYEIKYIVLISLSIITFCIIRTKKNKLI